MVTDRDMWAEAHFGKAKLGDKRRTQRLVRLAKQFAAVPGGTIPLRSSAARFFPILMTSTPRCRRAWTNSKLSVRRRWL
ncbi:MAG: IS4/Tn5 family transposase DNA-binding protein [Phycisphaerae bacterium]